MKIPGLKYRCYLCDSEGGEMDSEARSHNCAPMQRLDSRERSSFVTFLPMLDPCHVSAHYWNSLPDTHNTDTDWFPRGPADITKASMLPDEHRQVLRKLLPFELDHLRMQYGLRCGNPRVSAYPIEGLPAFDDVTICDMATYLWSRTLKDPRSWAIINVALSQKVHHLAVWTAGNAAMSLAQLAYHINASSPQSPLVTVHAIVHKALRQEIKQTLQLWQCNVIEYEGEHGDTSVLDPKQIRRQVEAKVRRHGGPPVTDENYWHVTDGWDAVGLHMYRLIGAHLIRYFKPRYVIAPLGTGDLIVGLRQGINDIESVAPRATRIQLIGVVPQGTKSCLESVRMRDRDLPNVVDGASDDMSQPDLPKLEGRYTPLAPVLHKMLHKNELTVIRVGRAAVELAAQRILSGRGIVACEPSALAGFAALDRAVKAVREWEGWHGEWVDFKAGNRLLVIGCGCGLMSRDEQAIVSAAQ